MDDWDSRSEWPDAPHDHARREEPRLQEYDWARERQNERRVPIAIIEAILTELSD